MIGLPLQNRQLAKAVLLVFVIAILALFSGGRATASGDGQVPASGAGVQLMQAAQQQGSVRLLVRLRTDYRPEGAMGSLSAWWQRYQIARAQDSVLARLPQNSVTASHRFEHIPVLAVEVNPAGLAELETDPDVLDIQQDVAVPPSLAESVPLVGADSAWSAGFDGAGWAVAVLDSGVDASHPALSGKVIDEACFSGAWAPSQSLCPNGQNQQIGSGAGINCSTSIYGCDHGTHVAGIAVGNGNPAGVAKGGSLIPVQIFSEFSGADCATYGLPSPCALTWTTDQLSALDWVYGLRTTYNIAAVNLSIGGATGYISSCDSDSRAPAFSNLRSVGIAPVVAAGNNGFVDQLTAPACISSAVSVGASTSPDSSGGADKVAGYSNVSPLLSLFAPGSTITSSVPGGGYETWNGTSMAAPHVAGAFAILREKDGSSSADILLSALTSTGVTVTDTRPGGTVSKPRIQIDAALALLGPTATATNTYTPSATATATPTDTATATPTPTATSTATSTPTFTATASDTPTDVPTTVPSATPSSTPPPTETPGPTPTPIFGDVPATYWAYDEINALYVAGYVAGCSADPLLYCPDRILNRAESAVFVLRGQYGAIADPPYASPPTPTFTDVASSFWGYGWIESLWQDGFTAGCNTNPLEYCPGRQHTRAEGSVFFLRIKNGVGYDPPPPSGLFADVTASDWYAGWVEAAYNQGLLPACNADPLEFCPNDLLDRAWAAYMMVQAKGGLPLP
jgi:subtilisin